MRAVSYESVIPLISSTHLCASLFPPLSLMMRCHYPAGLETSFHHYGFYHILWAISGKIYFQEMGGEYFQCNPGTVIFIPSDCKYRWKTDSDSILFQCHHKGFSMRDYGYLSMLSGPFQRQLSAVEYSADQLDAFIRKIADSELSEERGITYSGEFFILLAGILKASGKMKQKNSLDSAVNRALLYIERNISRNISLAELAKHAGMGTSRLSELFRSETGLSPMQYFAGRKAEEAEKLLSASTLSVSEVAACLGFSRANYFSRFMKKQTGKSPVSIISGKLSYKS